MDYSLTSFQNILTVNEVATFADQFNEQLWGFALLATNLISNECRRDFCKKTYTEYLDTKDNRLSSINFNGRGSAFKRTARPINYSLKGFPITSPTDVSVEIEGIPTEDFLIEPERSKLIVTAPMRRVERGLRVVYDAGYEVTFSDATNNYTTLALAQANAETTMVGGLGLAGLFDFDSNKTGEQSSRAPTGTGRLDIVFSSPEIIKTISWVSPIDTHIHEGVTTTTFTVYGSVEGDFTDSVVVATKHIPTTEEA